MSIMKENYLRSAHDTTFSPAGLYNLVKGNELVDSSGNSKNLTEYNAAAEDSDFIRGSAEGLSDGIYYRNNTSDFQYTGAMTLAGLAYVKTRTPDQIIQIGVANNIGAVDALYALQITTSGVFRYAHQNSQTVYSVDSDRVGFQLFKWHHFCFTRDSNGTGVKLYLDGVLIKTGTAGAAPGSQGQPYFSVGGVANTNSSAHDDGIVSSVAIYGQELSANQIKYLARKTLGYKRVE